MYVYHVDVVLTSYHCDANLPYDDMIKDAERQFTEEYPQYKDLHVSFVPNGEPFFD